MSGACRIHHSRHLYLEMDTKSISEISGKSLFACCIDCLGNNEWRLHIPDIMYNGLDFPDNLLILGKIPRKMHKIVWLQRGDIVQIDKKSLLDSIAESTANVQVENAHQVNSTQRQKVASWERNGVGTVNAKSELLIRVPIHFVMIDRKITQQQIRQLQMKFGGTPDSQKINDLSVASEVFVESHSTKITHETMQFLAVHNSGKIQLPNCADVTSIHAPNLTDGSEKKTNNFIMDGNRSMGWRIGTSSESEYEEEVSQ